MGWPEYYKPRQNTLSFRESYHAYWGAISRLSPWIFEENRPLTWVLGGCYPHNGSAKSFYEFCREVHPHPGDQHILLDMNRLPLVYDDNSTGIKKVQAKLENLSFREGSIDILFLDCTLEYMRNSQIRKFSDDIHQALSPNGLILATSLEPILPPIFRNVFSRWLKAVPSFYYSQNQLKLLTSPLLKIVLEGDYRVSPQRSCTIRALAKTEHQLLEYQDDPIHIPHYDMSYPRPVLQP